MISDVLISWYNKNKRDLPWRNTTDPYKVWLSEIILQQTRVDQGMSYYIHFAETFPTIKHLADAPEQKVMKLWQGLGYYSRARNLHTAAKTVRDEFDCKFPNTHDKILRLKGVGSYTAAAIASFCFNECYPVVDGNVYRVLARLYGIKTPIDSTKGKKDFHELAFTLINKKNPGLFNQAIMEFGALQCKPKNPDCEICPLNSKCIAFEKKLVDKLPVKSKSLKQRNRYFNYFFIHDKNSLLLRKRTGKDIWENLYDFPLIETDKPEKPEKVLHSKEGKKTLHKLRYSIKNVWQSEKHILSHQIIHASFIELTTTSLASHSKEFILVKKSALHKYPVPRLIEKYIVRVFEKQKVHRF